MSTVILFLGLFILIGAVGVAIADHYNKKKIVLFFSLLLGIFGFGTLISQHFKEIEDDAKIAVKDSIIKAKNLELKVKSDTIKTNTLILLDSTKTLIKSQNSLIKKQDEAINKELELLRLQNKLMGYSTGGDNNKPVIFINFVQDTDSTFQSNFLLYNRGNYPLFNVNFEIEDTHTLEHNFLSSNKIRGYPYGRNNDLIEYQKTHKSEGLIRESFPVLPKGFYKFVHHGKLSDHIKRPSFKFAITWNNGFYSAMVYYEGIYTNNTLTVNFVNNLEKNIQKCPI